eukprot:CAMPEP_0175189098 /NCGR_PEP_ID=MMETSP0093-20121207/3755_1 /TAXON_ID=311494 /ORGANISM="Alexandrium monilatum, Strain CCMP3105" /LENGTH=84 /DNA_ID=CAMNT_0016481887 /DNA_START=371 /DNA_END=622 /DNA_ORIENTATION=+
MASASPCWCSSSNSLPPGPSPAQPMHSVTCVCQQLLRRQFALVVGQLWQRKLKHHRNGLRLVVLLDGPDLELLLVVDAVVRAIL